MARRAVVVGASISGLMAARVLSEHFDHVTLVERDRKGDNVAPRKGVPQGSHVHVLWSGGMGVLDHYFPDLIDELRSRGSVVYDNSKSMRWFQHGVWKARVASGLKIHAQTRPLLEHCIRERVVSLSNVHYLDGHSLASVQFDEQSNQVTGITLKKTGRDDQQLSLETDLVVDCSGRTGAVLSALGSCGVPPPIVDTVGVDLGYATRTFKPPVDEARDWESMVIYPKAPETYTSGVIFPMEGGNWIVTLVGVHGRFLKSDDAEDFLEFAKGLDRPELYGLISRATPISPVRRLRFSGQQRRRVEDWQSAPGGMLALGDSICSLNPLYGQGMTVCAVEASMLDQCLKTSGTGVLDSRFVMDYFNKVSPVVDTAWLLATSSDFLYPETTGKRPFMGPLIGWYIARLLRASSSSPAVLLRFLEVLHFTKPLPSLLAPSVLLRVLLSTEPDPAS